MLNIPYMDPMGFGEYATVKMGSSSPGIGMNIKNIWVATTLSKNTTPPFWWEETTGKFCQNRRPAKHHEAELHSSAREFVHLWRVTGFLGVPATASPGFSPTRRKGRTKNEGKGQQKEMMVDFFGFISVYKHDIRSGSVQMYIYIYTYHFILHSEFLATTKNMFFCFGGIVLKKMCQRCMSNVRIMTCGL